MRTIERIFEKKTSSQIPYRTTVRFGKSVKDNLVVLLRDPADTELLSAVEDKLQPGNKIHALLIGQVLADLGYKEVK